MKTLTLISLWLLAATVSAQTPINKTIPIKGGQKIRMRFDYPKLVQVSTWDKNEILITGSVSINGGESDGAFKLETGSEGNTVTIRNEIENMNSLPRRITVVRDGQRMVFRNKAEWRKYQNENGGGHSMMNDGVELEIELNIKVPRNTETYVESVYGMVEIKDFTGPLTVQATYGGVDATLIERSMGELIAETNYGHIYTDLDIKVNGGSIQEEDFHIYVSAKPGTGPRYSFESTYGNVYLRKSN